MDAHSTSTLLVFTLGADAESARRGLLPAGHRALETELWAGCFAAALDAGRASGCRLEVCSPAPLALPADAHGVRQPEGAFGARLDRALRDAFARGAGSVLVVGTDVPGLAARHLDRARAALDEDPERVVLGPSPDGGFYLLACARPLAGLAGATRWRRRDTLRGLIRSLRAAGRPVVLLDALGDLDRRADLDSWLATGAGTAARWRGLARALARLLADLRRPGLAARSAVPRAVVVPVLAGRAPPAAPSCP
jgi:2-phospho-L-lactate guanylyltransferase (CobY/MobA/RfbA family)